MGKNGKVITEEIFNNIKTFLDSGLATEKNLSIMTGYNRSSINRISNYDNYEAYEAFKEKINLEQRSRRAKAKELKTFNLVDEPVQTGTAIGGQAMDKFVSEIIDSYPPGEPLGVVDTYEYQLTRIADALERLADAWENNPKKTGLFR